MADNVTVVNSPGTDYAVRGTEVTGGQIQHVRIDVGSGTSESVATGAIPTSSASYSLRLDEAGTYTYIGEATPGTATSAASWRIKRITEADSTILWADGDSNFNNIWDNRASLTYT